MIKVLRYSLLIGLGFHILFLAPSQVFSQKMALPEAYSYDAKELIYKGIELHEAEKFDSAIIFYNRVHKGDPDYLFACYEKLNTYQSQQKYKETISFVEKEIGLDCLPKFPQLYIVYGNALDVEKQSAKSDSIFEIGKKLMPNSSNLMYNQAIVKIKLSKNQEAINLLKQTIELDPDHSSAIYFLGLMAFDNGLLSQGCLAMLASITCNPEGRYATEALLKLNEKMAQKFEGKKLNTFSDTGDDFSELEEILRNQLPLNPKYKLKGDIDDVAIRNIQAICEYAKTHDVKSGFFEQKFIPHLAEIESLGLTETFIYYCLLSLDKESKIGKKVMKHIDEIRSFNEAHIGKKHWETFGKRKDIYGLKGDVVVYYEDGKPSLVSPVVKGMKQGSAIELNKKGDIDVRSFYKDDKLDGLITIYNDNGGKKEEITFKVGIKNGKNIKYYSNGNIHYTQTYVNDELNGPYHSFYPNGSKKIELELKNGKINNVNKSYFQNGKIKYEQNYKDGMLNGKSTFYNEVGDITSTTTYINDKLDGEWPEYFDGKTLKNKGVYKNDIMVSYISYFPSGKTSEETKQNVKSYYNQLGMKTNEEFYTDNFNVLVKSINYDSQGKIVTVEEFDDNGDVKSFQQYTNASEKPIESKSKLGKHEFKYRTGIKSSEGALLKKKKDKQWIFYNQNGRVVSKVNYEKGYLNGLSMFYDRYSNMEAAYNNINGRLEGQSITYLNNQLSSLYHYKEDELNGPFERYTDGKLKLAGAFSEGDKLYEKEMNGEGSVIVETNYISGELSDKVIFDQSGKEVFRQDFNNFNGKISYDKYLANYEETYKAGVLEGPSVIKYKNGSLIKEANFINDKEHGKVVYYNLNGTPATTLNYYAGSPHGEAISYDFSGKMKSKYIYHYGDDSGISQRYYNTGKLFAEYSNINEVFFGQNRYYNEDGELVLKLNFENDFVTSYSYLEKGTMKDVTEIDTNKIAITSTLADGSIVSKLDIRGMEFNGKFIINGKDGKPDFEAEYLNGKLHGQRTEYYPNNKICKSEAYRFNDSHGKSLYFDEAGNPVVSINYEKDDYNGESIVYKDGKKVKTFIFKNGYLVDYKNH